MARTFPSPPFSAVFDGNVADVQKYLDLVRGVMNNVEGKTNAPFWMARVAANFNSRGQTMLYIACRFGHAEIVNLLVDFVKDVVRAQRLMIPDVNAQTMSTTQRHFLDKLINTKNESDGSVPLHGACYGGHHQIVAVLIENGADATVVNNEGEKPLDNASEPAEGVSAADKRKTVAAVKKVPKKTKAQELAEAREAKELQQKEQDQEAPAAKPVEKKEEDEAPPKKAKKLEDSTPATTAPTTGGGDAPEHIIIKPDTFTAVPGNIPFGEFSGFFRNRAEVLRRLPEMNDMDKLEVLIWIKNCTHATAKEKKTEFPFIVDAILNSGFDITKTDADYYNRHPLFFGYEAPGLVTRLLQHGIRHPGDKYNNQNYVHMMMQPERVENMGAYIGFFKLDVNKHYGYGRLPVTHAVRVNAHKCLKDLIARGADVNKTIGKGMSPMLEGVRQYDKWSNKKEQTIQILIDAGAYTDFIIPSTYNDPAVAGKNIQEVLRPKNPRVLEMLKKAGKKAPAS